jgi:predicted DNA-binding ribbon-helix-helix protein
MDELAELRTLLEAGRIEEALLLVDELDEMSREDKINKISSYMRVLLIHLIKQHAEQRHTRSWEVSIKEAVRQINRTNSRRKAAGTYLSREELQSELEDVYDLALERAALEAFGGVYSAEDIAARVSRAQVLEEALMYIVGEVPTQS